MSWYVLSKAGCDRTELTAMREKWNWIGHTLRKSRNSITKQSLRWTPRGDRDMKSKEHVEENVGEKERKDEEMEKKAQDCVVWLGVVSGLCSSKN